MVCNQPYNCNFTMKLQFCKNNAIDLKPNISGILVIGLLALFLTTLPDVEALTAVELGSTGVVTAGVMAGMTAGVTGVMAGMTANVTGVMAGITAGVTGGLMIDVVAGVTDGVMAGVTDGVMGGVRDD